MRIHSIYSSKKTGLTLLSLLLVLGCQTDDSDLQTVKGSSTAEIFTDTPIGMGTNFYFPYGPDANNPPGSKFTAWTVDQNVSYQGNASMRFDVPNEKDPEGNFAGAIFRVDGPGRDLTGYDSLTFWAKASQGINSAEFGFGEDFYPNKYITTMKNVSLGTAWAKYIIPIPDASKLINEKGMFRYSAGTQDTNGKGYTFWIDELKFEKLGTIGNPRLYISNGVNKTIDSFNGITIPITLKETFNMPNGLDQSVIPAVGYIGFRSSNNAVATVDDKGIIKVLSLGVAIITANIGGTLNTDINKFFGGVNSFDSITINSFGNFSLPPTPTRSLSNVISVFSDFYPSIKVDFFNGYWQPYQTTLSNDFEVNGDKFLNYTNFNFVGHQFANPTADLSQMSHLHFNMYIPNALPSNFDFLITVVDFGPDGQNGGGDDTRQQLFVPKSSNIKANEWLTIELPLNMYTKNRVGLIIYENINDPGNIKTGLQQFYMDNVYFYKE
jgi:hypothetical protein